MPKDSGGRKTKIRVNARRRKNVPINGQNYDEVSPQGRAVRPGFQTPIFKQRPTSGTTYTWLVTKRGQPKKK